MSNPPAIVEVIGRSTQGMTRPFICRADDDNLYFVKGRYASTRSLVCEWLAGALAKSFGLPIVPFTKLLVPDALLELKFAAGEPLQDLGSGVVFGSLRSSFSELTVTTANKVSASLKADVVVFDWWIHNEDRTLTDKGGNPNLFWDPGDKKLWVLDHNLAFDPGFNKANFLRSQAFAAQWHLVASDFEKRQSYEQRLSDALAAWPEALSSLQHMWHYVDSEQTVPLGFEFNSILARLQDCRRDNFWGF